MSPSTNTRSGSIASKETLSIVPLTYPTSHYLSKYDLNNIQNDIKTMIETKLWYESLERPHLCYDWETYWYKFQDTQARRTTNRYFIQTLNLQSMSRETDHEQDTDIDLVTPDHKFLSKLSAYENRLEIMSIANITKFETEIKN